MTQSCQGLHVYTRLMVVVSLKLLSLALLLSLLLSFLAFLLFDLAWHGGGPQPSLLPLSLAGWL